MKRASVWVIVHKRTGRMIHHDPTDQSVLAFATRRAVHDCHSAEFWKYHRIVRLTERSTDAR